MPYYPDLSLCPYFGPETADKLVAIGWLDDAHTYEQGEVGEAFLDKLIALLAKPRAPIYRATSTSTVSGFLERIERIGTIACRTRTR